MFEPFLPNNMVVEKHYNILFNQKIRLVLCVKHELNKSLCNHFYLLINRNFFVDDDVHSFKNDIKHSQSLFKGKLLIGFVVVKILKDETN
jgi:hypothetical protein